MDSKVKNYVGSLTASMFGKFPILHELITSTHTELISKGAKTANTANSPLERTFKDKLCDKGYSGHSIDQLLNNTTKKEFAQILRRHKSLPFKLKGNWFIHQPCGTQSAPDFIIGNGDAYICIDLKSNKKSETTMLNSGEIHNNFLYINVFKQGTYYFFGADFPKPAKRTLDKVRALLKECDATCNKLLKKDRHNNIDMTIISRPSWFVSSFNKKPGAAKWIATMKKSLKRIKECTV